LLRQLGLRQQGAQRITQPVAVIGPGDASDRACALAYAVAAGLAGAGMSIVCGGRGGVMEAASRGAYEVKGVVIGLLPEEDTRSANPYLTIALPTGMGEMRNALIARSAACLVAIGSNLGTISEMAMGLKWGKAVFSLLNDVRLEGETAAPDFDHLMQSVTVELLAYRQA
jgi:uncharacterized protein (TIGR00725 family)